MKLFLKLTVGTLATGWFFLLWCMQMILASDIPVTISFDEMQDFLQIFSISTFLALVYVRFVDDTKLHYFLVIPILLWSMNTIQDLEYNYHPYDTLISCVSLIGCLLIFLYSILKQRHKLN
ncbi:hypothetical protein AA984_22815 [Brevibacillus formosus]|uniref:Uncharacterized protein n=1 Tax=Brevibacillus formosus TaxID=54913 RepID=A0A837KIH0_9BACL|nr:hypothetical protein AA984_22815 [Brevibacillus formosus]PSJ97090.1 hypothetical protein C7R91_10660 [Brevibacillus formosus]